MRKYNNYTFLTGTNQQFEFRITHKKPRGWRVGNLDMEKLDRLSRTKYYGRPDWSLRMDKDTDSFVLTLRVNDIP